MAFVVIVQRQITRRTFAAKRTDGVDAQFSTVATDRRCRLLVDGVIIGSIVCVVSSCLVALVDVWPDVANIFSTVFPLATEEEEVFWGWW